MCGVVNREGSKFFESKMGLRGEKVDCMVERRDKWQDSQGEMGSKEQMESLTDSSMRTLMSRMGDSEEVVSDARGHSKVPKVATDKGTVVA